MGMCCASIGTSLGLSWTDVHREALNKEQP